MTDILVVSDLHCGSRYSVKRDVSVFEDEQTHDDLAYGSNATQRKLYALWLEMRDRVGKVDALVVNGDCCEGSNYKASGFTIWTTTLREQVEEAAALLKLIRAKHVYVTLGSNYHVYENSSLDQAVSKVVGGEFSNDLLLDVKRRARFHFAHYIGVSSSTWQYRTTPLARDLLLMAVNRAADKYGDVDWIVRSHAHYFVFAGFSKQTGVITPCWKRRDVYAVKKGLLTPPDIGYVLFHIESDGEVTMERDVRHFGQAARLVRI